MPVDEKYLRSSTSSYFSYTGAPLSIIVFSDCTVQSANSNWEVRVFGIPDNRHEKYGDQETQLAKSQDLWAFYAACPNHGFRSMACRSKLHKQVLEKFCCGRTKCEAMLHTNIIFSKISCDFINLAILTHLMALSGFSD